MVTQVSQISTIEKTIHYIIIIVLLCRDTVELQKIVCRVRRGWVTDKDADDYDQDRKRI